MWRRGGAAVALLLLLLTLATARAGDPTLYPAPAGRAETIYLLDNGWHSDLAVPTAVIEAHGGALAAAARQTSSDSWTMIGWGDARFYEASSPALSRIPDGLSALLGGRPTVVHLEGVYDEPDRVWRSGVRPISLSRRGLAALLDRADSAFVHGPGGAPIIVPIRRVPREGFFASGERFSAAHLCNHWTAELLNAAGVPVTPVIDTLPAGLALDLELRAGL